MIQNISSIYGFAEIDVREEILNIREVKSETIPEEYAIGLDEAEELSLILEKVQVQFAPYRGSVFRVYFVIHKSPSEVQLAKVIKYKYTFPMGARDILKITPTL